MCAVDLNGVDEAIHLVCAGVFGRRLTRQMVCTPTFFMYEVSAGMMTAHVKKVRRRTHRSSFHTERFLAAITPRTKLIMVGLAEQPHRSCVVSREQLLALQRGGTAGGSDGGRGVLLTSLAKR